MINPRIQVLTLQIAAICLGINAAGRYVIDCDIDGGNCSLNVRLREYMAPDARDKLTRVQRLASWVLKETIYLDDFSGSLNPPSELAGRVCEELEALLTKLLAYHPAACEVAA